MTACSIRDAAPEPTPEGIIRWCAKHDLAVPRVTGVESDPRHVAVLRDKFAGHPAVEIRHADYLLSGPGEYEFIVGNPPYVAITGLSQAEKQQYRAVDTTYRS